MSGMVRWCQESSSYVRLGQVAYDSSGYVRLVQVRTG